MIQLKEGVEKEIKDKYNMSLRGNTWDYYPRDKFDGVIITPKNRREVLRSAFIDAMAKMIKSEGIDEEEITDEHRAKAMAEARTFVNMNQKAHKKYLKGESYMRYKGQKYMIPMVGWVEDMKRRLAQFQEKYQEEFNKIEEE